MTENTATTKDGFGNVFFVSLSQFWVNLSFNFMFAFLPFYINKISHYTPEQTLLWTGAIFGSTSLCVAFSGPFWGALTSRVGAKFLYLAGLTVHCVTFIAMAFTTNLPLFLILRILQGFFGGTATIGLIIISSSDSPQKSRDIGIFQSSITFGQLIGPPLGTLAVTFLGYGGGFLSAGLVVAAILVLCYFFIHGTGAGESGPEKTKGEGMTRTVLVTWLLCLIAQVQLMFLPSILPTVFHTLGLTQTSALRWAGWLITLYTVTAMIGTYVWCSLARKVGTGRLITLLMIGGIALQCLLIFPRGVIGYTIIRMAQTGLIAAVIPLSLALFAGKAGGFTMGFLYSSRFVGNAIGPIMATALVAYLSIPTLYLSICGFSLLVLAVFRFFPGSASTSPESSS